MADVFKTFRTVVWLNIMKKRRRIIATNEGKRNSLFVPFILEKKRQKFAVIQAILSCLNPPRLREIWMHPHSLAWFDMVEASFTEEQWYFNFRVTKGTFIYVLHEIYEDIAHQDTSMRKAIPATRRLAITLYYLASTAEYRTIANLFGVSISFVCSCIKEVCNAIVKLMSSAISFPSGENLLRVIQGYEEWGFPMCAGAIDGTHIPIIAPKESHTDYINRKSFHSIIMQAVVDHNQLFRDIVVGWPGSVHDARVFSNSTLFVKGNSNKLFSGNCSKQMGGLTINPVIIGDAAYPLLPWLMKPYPENSTTPNIKRKFNYHLSRARMTVENAFGRWKGRFIRFSKRVDMEVTSLAIVVTASCILHNICEIQNNEFLPVWHLDTGQGDEDAVVFLDDNMVRLDAEDVRGVLANHIV